MAGIAPGSVKLFGEHAVVYDRIGVSASFDRHATVRVAPSERHHIELTLPDFGFNRILSEEEVLGEHRMLKSIFEKGEMERLRVLRNENFTLPFSFILGEAFLKTGFRPLKIDARSTVPKRSGLGSSSAIFAALACELNAVLKLKLSAEGIAELANQGERVVHGRPSGIDAYTSALGGYLRFRKSEGPRRLEVGQRVPLVIVNTMVHKDTGEMIAHVMRMFEKDRARVGAIFDDMEEAALGGIDALAEGDMIKLGAEFQRTQACFERLGLNTRETDEIVRVALKHAAYGAKISGAGGGGAVIVLSKAPSQMAQLLGKLGYQTLVAQLGVVGARHQPVI